MTFAEWYETCPASSRERFAVVGDDESGIEIHTCDSLYADSCEHLDGLFHLRDFVIVDMRPFELRLERRLRGVAIVSAPLC